MKDYKDTSLSFTERVEALMSQMTLKEKLMILIETSQANERLDIPQYYHGNEALHGVVRPGRYTVFPQAISFGATFDTDLIRDIADAISNESRAMHHHGRGTVVTEKEYDARYTGLLTFWSPDLNLCRDPRWGRTAETYGEDPYLAGKLGAAFVRGMQGNDPKYLKAVSTPKHFTANNEEKNRFGCNAKMTEKDLREYHLAPFKMVVEEGKCEAVMAAYNAINGVPCHMNKRLLDDILRKEWGFKGYVVSDCGAVARIWDSHKAFENPEDAAAAALNAGVDLECGGYSPYEHFYYTFIEKQVESGNVSEDRVNEACRNVLTARFKLGQFDPEEDIPFSKIPLSVIGSPKHVALAKRCAVESMVLLKNNGVLPLKSGKKVAVVGNNAAVCQFGDYSGKPLHPPVSALDGMKRFGGEDVVFVPWHESAKAYYAPVSGDYLRTESGERGLTGEYFACPGLLGESRKRTDDHIEFAWRKQMPDSFIVGSEYSIRWTGSIVPPVDGVYQLRLTWNGSAPCEPPILTVGGEACGTGAKLTWKAGVPVDIAVEYIKREENPAICLEWIVPETVDHRIDHACEAAAKCDSVVAVIGLGTEFEHEGKDKDMLDLPEEQVDLVKRLYEVNKNLIVVVLSGSPVTIPEIHDNSAAVIEGWYPGEQGGNALAELLYGFENFSGRLCATFPKSVNDIPPMDDYVMTHGRTYLYSRAEPQYPFGFGLSYTRFEYSNLKVEPSEKEGYTVEVKLTNVGTCDGDEVTQIYLDSANMQNQPLYKLVRFTRTRLQPGESAVLRFNLDEGDFIRFNENGKECLFSGTYTLYAGGALPVQRSIDLGEAQWVSTAIKR